MEHVSEQVEYVWVTDYRGRRRPEAVLDHTPRAWDTVAVGYGGRSAEEGALDDLYTDEEDPRPDQRVDSAGYQRWRRRHGLGTGKKATLPTAWGKPENRLMLST